MNDEKSKDLTSIFDLPPAEELADEAHKDLSPSASDFSFDLEPVADPITADISNDISTHPPAPETIESIKQFSESVPIGQAKAAPTDPFTVRITGHLEIHEQTKLLDLIRIHDMGFRDSDLEPQIQAGRILLSRMSEYAAVLIVQALRGARADIQVFPENQDETFAAVENRPRIETDSGDEPHPAELIPVTQDTRIPSFKTVRVIDVVTASYSFLTPMVNLTQNSEYDETLQALTRELKYRAYRKKANALLHFRVQLLPLSLDSGHRLVISATAALIEPQSQ